MDLIGQYKEEIGRYSRLTREEEQELGRRARLGDKEALDQLVQANLPFVIRFARKFEGRGLPLEDLISAGNEGLIRAAQKFDPSKNVRLIHYATWWIRQSIRAALNDAPIVHETPTQMGRINQVIKFRIEFKRKHGREPEVADIVSNFDNISEAMAKNALEYHVQEVSFDQPISPDSDDGATLGSILSDNEDWEEKELEEELKEELHLALRQILTEREALIIALFYGLADQKEWSLEEIGTVLSLCRERVRQLKNGAIQKLQNDPRSERLREAFGAVAAA